MEVFAVSVVVPVVVFRASGRLIVREKGVGLPAESFGKELLCVLDPVLQVEDRRLGIEGRPVRLMPVHGVSDGRVIRLKSAVTVHRAVVVMAVRPGVLLVMEK